MSLRTIQTIVLAGLLLAPLAPAAAPPELPAFAASAEPSHVQPKEAGDIFPLAFRISGGRLPTQSVSVVVPAELRIEDASQGSTTSTYARYQQGTREDGRQHAEFVGVRGNGHVVVRLLLSTTVPLGPGEPLWFDVSTCDGGYAARCSGTMRVPLVVTLRDPATGLADRTRGSVAISVAPRGEGDDVVAWHVNESAPDANARWTTV
ncbi:MAG TPA: hypothetical protein VNX21_02505, partial [Candidatus Thermoplasmatota archaeon]|nr:hypothetical protein [Candidatus Thermoplasmatota archaeon]